MRGSRRYSLIRRTRSALESGSSMTVKRGSSRWRLVVRQAQLRRAIVHHVGKGNARNGAVDQYAGRGGSAGADNARFVHILAQHVADGDGFTAPRQCSSQDVAEGRLLRLHVAKLSHGKRPAAPIGSCARDHLRASGAAGDRPGKHRERAAASPVGLHRQRRRQERQAHAADPRDPSYGTGNVARRTTVAHPYRA